MYDHTKTELYLPNACFMEAPIRLNKNIPGEAKIYFGELAVLANKHNVIKYTDEQLSKMKDVPVSTIEKWHRVLRKYGFLTSHTFNVLLPLEEGENTRKWRKFRDMKINQRPESKEDCGTAEIGGINEPAEIGGINEPAENGGISSTKEKNKKRTTEELAAPVVDSSKDIKLQKKEALEKLKVLTDGQIISLLSRSLEDILKACELFRLEEKVDDPVRWLNACISQKWWNTADPEKVKEQSLFESFQKCLVEMKRDHKEDIDVILEDNYIHMNTSRGGFELTKSSFNDDATISNFLNSLNEIFVSNRKLVHVKLHGKNVIEVMR